MTHTGRSLVLLLLVGTWLRAQAPLPNPLPTDLETLARQVEAAHHPKGQPPAVSAMQGSLSLYLYDPDSEQRGQVDTSVTYLEWQRPGTTKTRHLFRYEIVDAERPVAAGRDQLGYWRLVQGAARDLTEADAEDRAACERYTSLTRQLLRFLQPGQVLRSLTAPSAVGDEPLQLGREAAVPCRVVRGDLPGFPLLQQGGEDAPVRVTVFVAAGDGTLQAVEATPLRDGRPDPTRAELVRLAELQPVQDRLLPRQLLHYKRAADGRLRLAAKVTVTLLDLAPQLTVTDLDRPKSK